MLDDLDTGFFHTKPRKKELGVVTAILAITVAAGIVALLTVVVDFIQN
ncbi:hypothetical protein [Phyllobacterium myrsinacearum]|uniref:Uncharacterized protein n=1 Tax=Phyllobacterium myrsinacearum TaxID=28101 RepID=A0A839EM79_9HYPH|nr:hypothetical protein [Phyllobacterium myrsinacearum]MBA8881663.1 hypothetical protein [Phyllobacterium myrsinacearum]